MMKMTNISRTKIKSRNKLRRTVSWSVLSPTISPLSM
jgi:hypothetical protein